MTRLPAFRTRFAAAVLAALTGAAIASAHDFWIIPNAFVVAPGSKLEVLGQTSVKFPTTVSAVTPDRIADARLIAANGEERIVGLSVAGKSLALTHRPSTAGQRVVAVSLVPRTSRTAPAALKRYIGLEGSPELAERYERDGAFKGTDSLTQHTTKYAKTVVEIGSGGPRAYTKVAGHALEFVPVTDPSLLKQGDTLTIRLLFRGQPLAGAHFHAGAAPPAALQDSTALRADWKDHSLVTDEKGIARVPIDHAGLWNLRTLHAAPAATDGGKGWEVAFATIVFQASAGAHAHNQDGGPAEDGSVDLPGAVQPARDSAAVAAVVERFHASLAAGDSTTALSLLAQDAVILESGGIETRNEYRSHHLPGDIGFARAIRSERGAKRVVVRGDVAWVTSTSTTSGDYRGRAVNSAGAELMVLTREGQQWQITAVHWSSRTRRPAGS